MKKDTRNSIIAIGAGAAILGFLIKKSIDQGGSTSGEGSLGGSDDQFNDALNPYAPEGNPFRMIDPNYQYEVPYYYPTTPSDTTPDNNTPSYIPNAFTPIPSSNGGISTFDQQGGKFQGDPLTDLGIMGGAFAVDAAAKLTGKGVKNILDTKYKFPELPENKLRRFLQDPYSLEKSALKESEQIIGDKLIKESSETAVEKASKIATSDIAKSALKEAPAWAKGLKTFTNFIPLIDVPIGAALDVYFTKDDENPIGWGDAFAGNLAGELAQVGVTAAGAAAGFGVGGIPAWFVGTAADVSATEAYYAARGKSSLFSSGSTSAGVITQNTINDKPVISAVTSNPILDAIGYGSAPMSYAPINIGSTPSLSGSSSKSSSSSSNAKKVTSSGAVVNISTAKDPVVRNYENTNLVSTTLTSSQINNMNSFYSAIGISTTNPISSSSSSKSSSSSSSVKTDALSGKNKGKGSYIVKKADGTKVKRYYQ